MSKFLYLYRGPATPMEDFTEEQGQEQMRLWNEWGERAGTALVDFGAPFGPRTAVGDDGSNPAVSDQNGYSIVEAETLESATALTEKHPFLQQGDGRFSIEIFELMPM